jgi:hypothetical protein
LVLILAAVLMTFSLPPAAAQTVPPPQGGLGSKSNYYLYHDGKPIMRLTVAVEITKEVVCDDIGFHLHLNADSPETAQTKWQQYVMGFKPDFKENGKSEGPMVGGSIEYFASPNSFNTKTPPGPVKNLRSPSTLPAGAVFKIAIRYDGKDVSGADFSYNEKDKKNHHTWTIPVPPSGTAKAVRTPIVAFQLDLVGAAAATRR